MDDKMEWKSSIIQAIAIRDKYQKIAFADIYEKYQKNITEISKFKKKGSHNYAQTVSNDINADKISELNHEIEELKLKIASKDTRISMQNEDIDNLTSDNKELKMEIEELRERKKNLEEKEESFRSTIVKLEQIIAKLQIDHASLLAKYMDKVENNVKELNISNEKLWSTKNKEFSSAPDIQSRKYRIKIASIIPTKIVKNFDLPEDSYAITFNNSGSALAVSSGKEIYMFNTEQDLKICARLRGPVNCINSLDFSITDYLVLAASSDKACYIWNTDNNNLVENITGHTDKVSVARFMSKSGESITSAGRDRTLKFWDLRSKTCIHSLFLNSSCLDFVSLDTMSGITAHMDKNIRIFDFRSSNIEIEQAIPDKITSIFLSNDKIHLLVCSRDDSLHLYDTRLTSKVLTLTDKSLKIPCDWSKCAMSSDCDNAIVGSSNNVALIWNTTSKSIVQTLKGGHKYPIISCAWNPNGNGVATCDSRKHLTMWH